MEGLVLTGKNARQGLKPDGYRTAEGGVADRRTTDERLELIERRLRKLEEQLREARDGRDS